MPDVLLQGRSMAAGAESGLAHERVWAVQAVGQCGIMAGLVHDLGNIRLLHVVHRYRTVLDRAVRITNLSIPIELT